MIKVFLYAILMLYMGWCVGGLLLALSWTDVYGKVWQIWLRIVTFGLYDYE